MAQIGFGLNINEDAQKIGYDLYQQNIWQTLGAVAADNWNFNPLQMALTNRDLEDARQEDTWSKENIKPVSRKQLNEKYSDIGLFFENDEFQSVVDVMVSEKEEERARQSIISRGPQGSWNPFNSGFYVGAAKLGTGLAVSLADPFNVAASFIPVVGQAKFAAMAARTSLRTARLAKGAAEGAVGAVLVEPIVYSVAQKIQADYDLTDSFLNITFGTVIGGGLHVGVGKLKDINTARKFNNELAKIKKGRELLGIKTDAPDPVLNLYKQYYPENGDIMKSLAETDPETRRLLLQKSLGDMLLEDAVDVSPIVNADPVLKKTSDVVSQTPERVKPKSTIDTKTELNNVEKNNPNRNEKPTNDIEIENLQSRLNVLKKEQENLNLDMTEDASTVKLASEELDEINAKSKELDEVIADFINCTNGR
tara:strand:- start:1166 stop:2434 length:1269 start_codon:yes stop_codon:yes gene_type:complete